MPAKLKIIISISALAVFAATLLIFPETVLQGFSAIRSVFAAPTCDPSGTCSVLTTDGSGNFGIGANSDAVSRLFIKDADTSATKFGLKIVSSDGSTPVFVVRNDGAVSLASSTYVGGRLCFGTMGTGTDCVTSWSGVGGGVTSTPAGYVTPGYFNSVAGTGGNYSFPASLSVGTSTAPSGGVLFVNGNVGIGTASPGYALDVNGVLKVQGNVIRTGSGALTLFNGDIGSWAPINTAGVNTGDWDSTPTYGDILVGTYNFDVLRDDGTSMLSILNNGNVGIGTTVPQYPLDVFGTSNKLGLTYSYTEAYGSTGAELNADSNGDLHIIATKRGPLTTFRNILLADNGGKVGIATSTPAYPLSVAGTIYSSTGGYRFPDGTTQTTAAGSGTNYFTLSGTSLYPTSTAYKLAVGTATVDANYAITTAGGGIKSESTTQPAGYFNSASGYGLIVNTGNVGIGTSNPAYKLTVAGTIYSSSGGYRFPDGTTQTTAATAGTNYFTLSGSSLYPTSTAYNVGIGTSTPAYKLSVAGKVNADSQAGAGGYISSGNHGGTGSASWHPSGIYSAGTNWLYGTVVFNGAVSGATSISAGSFTGAGTGLTGTAASLIAGNVTSLNGSWTGMNYFQNQAGSGVYLRNAGGAPLEPFSNDGGAAYMSFHRGGAYAVNFGLDPDGSIAIGGWSDGAVNRIKIETTGNTTFGSTGTAKINVGTIDPPYTINGEQYATYLSGMIGQKEETTGEIILTCVSNTEKCSATIDANNQEKGSDLWLFAKTTNLKNNFSKMTVLLTPSFDGKVWYEKDIKNNVLKIFASPVISGKSLVDSYSVSYRLTAPRFDSAKWLNTRNDADVDGFIIND